LRLKCTKFYFGWSSAPDPAGRAYSAPPDSLAGLSWSTSKRRKGRGAKGKEEKGKEEKVKRGKGMEGEVKRWMNRKGRVVKCRVAPPKFE